MQKSSRKFRESIAGRFQEHAGTISGISGLRFGDAANHFRNCCRALELASGVDAGLTSELASGIDAEIAGTNPEFAPENYQPLKTNRYGDAALAQLKGIVSFGVEIITRVHTWTLATKSQVQRNAFCSHLEFCQ